MSAPEDDLLSSPVFLGPRGEGIDLLAELINRVLEDHRRYRSERASGVSEAPLPGPPPTALTSGLDDLLRRLHATYPYFHPRYAAQMIKDPSVPAVLGYFAAMLMNPNNHAYEGGPATTEMELEVVDALLRLAGFEENAWGHLCSGGTLANLEALWVVRDTRPEGAVIFSRASHYSLRRNATLLRIPRVIEIETDGGFHLDLNHLETILKKERAMFVVANAGTTGTGSVDPVEDLIVLRDRYGFHLHVDAAYGGYARACLRDPSGALLPPEEVRTRCGMSGEVYRHLAALQAADSLTIDPHKHGLSPYGAGCILYRDPALKRPLLNNAPYTYHVKERPNLGLITLEGSRPGAAAAACWLTQRVIPLDAAGYGAIIGAGMRVARRLHDRIAESDVARPLHEPDLDILCLVRWPGGRGRSTDPSLREIDGATGAVYRRLAVTAAGDSPLLLSRLLVPADLARRALGIESEGSEEIQALRLVLMKHWLALPRHAGVLEEIERALLG
ncbi:MAG: aminotransferase class I/II-fold pyridoxal phosphate-dependent enzyme [Acidobacteria bacterium]|nr:aminotransferase class I/II-fold pyridoxal phosphate-dependent enzyme [Acidobacteriota bacterium]